MSVLSSTSVPLSRDQVQQADEIVSLFREISTEKRLGSTDKITFTIDTGNAKPFKLRQYPFSPNVMNVLNVDSMLTLGVIEPSRSPWNSPVLIVNKKNEEPRFCFDRCRLHQVTKHDSYPVPRVVRILSMLGNAKFMSSIDLNKAFWQVPLNDASKEKTAFSISSHGCRVWTPF